MSDKRGQGGQVPDTTAVEFPGIALYQGLPYGTISMEVVTHRLLLLDWLHSPEGVYTRGNLLTIYLTMTCKSVR